jgi:hypothetical protein
VRTVSPRRPIRAIPPMLSVESTMTAEKLRGALASLLSGGTASSLTLYGVVGMGLSAPLSTLYFTYLLGGVLGYSLDILLAKRDFVVDGGAAPVRVPYRDLGTRLRWLLRSFAHRYFFRFVVTVIIETLTSLAMLAALIRAMNAHAFLPGWKLRDPIVAVAVAFLNFWLFGNVLRFDWAYREAEQPVLNVVVLMWMTLGMLVFAATWGRGDGGGGTL